MKTELQVKFLQHLTKKRQGGGFTLIELLVVIVILGILSAIALPAFLSQAAKAHQSEAKTNVGALNRSQQAYYAEKLTFTSNISDLGIGITNTNNYSYSAQPYTTLDTDVINKATSLKPDFKSYGGGVFKSAGGGITQAILCEAKNPGVAPVGPYDVFNCIGTETRMQ